MNVTPETTTTETPAAKLESQTCTRCGGSGHYSYNQIHGTICYGCGGKGRTLTKRGAAAARYLETIRSKPATEIVVGDVVWFDGAGITRSEWFTVETAEVKETNYTAGGEPRTQVDVRIAGTGRKGGGPLGMHVAPTSMVRVAQTAEGKAATYAQALAYQATLTKTGTPRKR